MLRAKPIVAILGRPNVGKSTLFNRLVGRRIAIVHDEPGVTRDRHYADAESLGRSYTLVDTGGFDPESADPMQQGIQRQIDIALGEADAIVCVLDGSNPLPSIMRPAVELLLRSGKPIVYAVNKCDSDGVEADAAELYRLGMSELHFISALHGRGITKLETALVRALDAVSPPAEAWEGEETAEGDLPDAGDDEDGEDLVAQDGADDAVAAQAPPRLLDPLCVAVIGRPNSGKSSLINRLAGEQRLLVHDAPGTTRDPIDTTIVRGGQRYVFVDTAGLRRKARVAKARDVVEARSVIQGIRAMQRAHVAVLLCDAAVGVAEQDAKILGLALERGRGLVIGLNKTDLLTTQELREAQRRAKDALSFVPWAPIVKLSAKTGDGTGRLLRALGQVGRRYVERVSTGELNRFFEEVLATHPPPTQGGKAPRFYYVTQAETGPPLFVVQTSQPDHVHFSYQRYVANAIRKRFGFEGVPVRIRYRRPGRRPAGKGKGGGRF